MYILRFATGEYLYSVSEAPFYYVRTTEREEACVYDTTSAAAAASCIVRDNTGHESIIEAAPLTYSVTRNNDGSFRIDCDAIVLVRLATGLGLMKDIIRRAPNDADYQDFVTMVQMFYHASTALQSGQSINQTGQQMDRVA